MARFGARFKNAATGSVQIDDLYANMALLSKSSHTVGTSVGNDLRNTTVTFTATDMPTIAFSCTAPTFLAWVVRDSGANTWAFTFSTYTTNASLTVTVYRFAEPPVLGEGWAIRIKRNGVVKYDSRHRYASVPTSLRGTFDTSSEIGTAGPSTTLTSGKAYALMMGSRTGRNTRVVTPVSGAQNGYNDNMSSAALAAAINGNVITSRYCLTQFSTTFFPVPPSPPAPSGYSYNQRQYSWAILDVTNF